MADAAHKKTVSRGHRLSANNTLQKAEDLLTVSSLDTVGLAQIKMSLQDKLVIIKELEQADAYTDTVQAMLVKVKQSLMKKALTHAVLLSAHSARGATSTVTPSAATAKFKLPELTFQSFLRELTS